MIFSEVYGAYYNAVAAILKEALSSDTQKPDIPKIVRKYAFGESSLTVEKALRDGAWPLLYADGSAVIRRRPEMPLTLLQKRWLKAIALDPRIRLFGVTLPDFPEAEPLFRPEDIRVYDRYADGDDYTDENYIRHFRLCLDAAENGYPVKFNVKNKNGKTNYLTAQPEYLEYSEKDDKFRVVTSGCRYGETINIGRIISCKRSECALPPRVCVRHAEKRRVVLEVTDGRNALERLLLHFAHFSKEAERIDEKRYRVTVEYDADDETEIVIRVLSFGPFVKAVAPLDFVDLIKQRLLHQKSCGLF